MEGNIKESNFLFYKGEDGNVHAQVILGEDTVYASIKTLSDIFDKDSDTIRSHIKNIFDSGELEEFATTAKNAVVQLEGNREVERNITFYNLEVIIAVGYRVNSYKATKFRQWATRILKQYLIKGFVLDDERLKQGNKLFGKDHFNELLARIREIRASERMFYEKVTDLYATSEDYDKNDPTTKDFFAKVQNKLEFAITGNTSAEIIKSRANASLPNMGLTSWKQSKTGGKIVRTDITIAKNYLSTEELKSLNLLVSAFLEHAEMLADRNKIMTMADWSKRLDLFLNFNEYKVLQNAGSIKKKVADAFADKQFDYFRVIQDKNYVSDFNRFTMQVRTNKLPSESDLLSEKKEPLSDFNNKLKTALNFNPDKHNKKPAKLPKGKNCPNCGRVNDKEANYCIGDVVDDSGDITPCGYSFIADDGRDRWD